MTNDEANIQEVLSDLKNSKKATTIIVGNQKGGVSKTINSCLIAYTLAKRGVKTLLADIDQQASATKILLKTKKQANPDADNDINKTVMDGIKEGSFDNLAMSITDNLDLLPSYKDLKDFSNDVYTKVRDSYGTNEADHIFAKLLEPLKKDYDVIILDTPPYDSSMNDNGLLASDYILISFQTQQGGFDGADDYTDTIAELHDNYGIDNKILGMIPSLYNKRNWVDKTMLKQAKEYFGEKYVFKNIVDTMPRIERYPVLGISNNDIFERRVLSKYSDITDEMLLRMYKIEKDGVL
ncbi:ParA family protein [Apilactobacillus timberlakei]|uniref:ParA family protein n=1 Tax=Apilactobacillus timberlakei TaxID=2008380 RepID=A0ABY2YRX0_9LACO|nr:ParA family protein [Apilactobacillus timberlakei]TPR12412.1 ParA family protein [Apilactobacillus timberlakei]TPR12952.1 ParA family protein [Apilactobacillus timberlakei]